MSVLSLAWVQLTQLCKVCGNSYWRICGTRIIYTCFSVNNLNKEVTWENGKLCMEKRWIALYTLFVMKYSSVSNWVLIGTGSVRRLILPSKAGQNSSKPCDLLQNKQMSRGIITNSSASAFNIYKNYLMSCFVNNMQIAIPVPSTFQQPSQTWGEGKCASTRKKHQRTTEIAREVGRLDGWEISWLRAGWDFHWGGMSVGQGPSTSCPGPPEQPHSWQWPCWPAGTASPNAGYLSHSAVT